MLFTSKAIKQLQKIF